MEAAAGPGGRRGLPPGPRRIISIASPGGDSSISIPINVLSINNHASHYCKQIIMALVAAAFLSAGIAALVTITVCVLVDHYGGTIAGVIGTVPHVAVVGSVGFATVLPTRDFQVAVLAMPVGMLLNSFYAAAMLAASRRLSRGRTGGRWRLPAVVVLGLSVFALGLCTLQLPPQDTFAFQT